MLFRSSPEISLPTESSIVASRGGYRLVGMIVGELRTNHSLDQVQTGHLGCMSQSCRKLEQDPWMSDKVETG